MNNVKKIFITLAIYAGVFFVFLTVCFCQNIQAVKATTDTLSQQPWNTRIVFCHGSKTYDYNLSSNLTDLTPQQLTDRLVFRSSRQKAKWLKTKTKEGMDLIYSVCYVFPHIQELFENMQNEINYPAKSSSITFSPNNSQKFTYTKSSDGLRINLEKTCQTLLQMLSNGKNDITIKISTDKLSPVTTYAEALKQTTKRGEFETSYVNSPKARQNNIALALSFFNGMIVEQDQVVSFNQTVGARTAERGFSVAKILQNGKYIDGVGGGVCQASTTLFNALLMADVSIKGVCQHSVKSSYVSPSFDAMVSDTGADLIFSNNTNNRLYISASCKNGKAKVEIYGLPNPYEIHRRANILKEIDYKTHIITDYDGNYLDKVVYTDETHLLTAGVTGVMSEGWLDYKKDGKIVFSKKIRTNSYNPIDCVIIQGAKQRPLLTPDQ